jgi:two-component system response regulator YesN
MLFLKENPSMKISQIAEMVGYQDMKYFSKVFKKTTGITPQEYRIAPGIPRDRPS